MCARDAFKLGLLILCYRSLKVEELETDSRRNRINYTSVDSSAFLIILNYWNTALCIIEAEIFIELNFKVLFSSNKIEHSIQL